MCVRALSSMTGPIATIPKNKHQIHRYAKLVEMRRHMDYFKASGKSLIAYMDAGAEKEYFLALGCDEVGVMVVMFDGRMCVWV